MSTVFSILNSQLFWGILAILASGVALSGKLSMVGAKICFVSAGILTVLAISRIDTILSMRLERQLSLLSLITSIIGMLIFWPGYAWLEGNQLEKIRADALSLAQDLRKFQGNMDRDMTRQLEFQQRQVSLAKTEMEKNLAWHSMTRDLIDTHERNSLEFGPLRVTAIILVEAMKKELPSDTKKQMSDSFAEIILETGSLAGAHPVAALADYIERMARALPK